MKVVDTNLHGVKLIQPERFVDFRGSYLEIYDSKKFLDNTGQHIDFVQDDISVSKITAASSAIIYLLRK